MVWSIVRAMHASGERVFGREHPPVPPAPAPAPPCCRRLRLIRHCVGEVLCGTSDSQPEKNQCAEELDAITLDELKIKKPIAIMKLDVEGMECVALKGAASTLKTSRPCIILTEFNPGLQKFSTCSIFDMAEYMAGEDYFPHAWEGMDGCSNAAVTYDGLAARDVPGELHNLC